MDYFDILFRSQLLIINILILITVVNCAEDGKADIVEYKNENNGDGHYYFKFLTSNGISREETGTLEGIDSHPVVKGSYSYQTPEGKLITVFYEADDGGYRILPDGIKDTGPKYPDDISIPALAGPPSAALVASILGK